MLLAESHTVSLVTFLQIYFTCQLQINYGFLPILSSLSSCPLSPLSSLLLTLPLLCSSLPLFLSGYQISSLRMRNDTCADLCDPRRVRVDYLARSDASELLPCVCAHVMTKGLYNPIGGSGGGGGGGGHETSCR